MKVGTVLPLWKEYRYLELVLEQMVLVPGPRLVVWQNAPLYWLGNGPAPSGHRHERTRKLLAKYEDQVEIMKIDRSPDVNDEFGGFKWIQQMAYKRLREEHGVELVFWQDSDWLFELGPLETLFNLWREAPVDGRLWNVPTQHYWRDFNHTFDTKPVTIGYPSDVPHNWGSYQESDMIRLSEPMLHHPAYVLSDAEMYDKVHSWGHAPLFVAENFFEKVWIGRNEAGRIDPKPAPPLPREIAERLKRAGALL